MLENDPHLASFVTKAEHLSDVGRSAEAIIELERALALSPDNAHILTGIAVEYLSLGDSENTELYLGRAIAADPDSVWPVQILASHHGRLGKFQQAYNDSVRAVQMDPEDLWSLRIMALFALALGRNEECRLLGELILEGDPEAIIGHEVLSMEADDRGDLATTVRHLRKVLELDPQDIGAIERLAGVNKKLAQAHHSTDLSHVALTADPGSADKQSLLKEAFNRLALFGQPDSRFQSLGFYMTLALLLCAGFWWLSLQWVAPTTAVWINRIVFLAFPLLAVSLLFVLRTKRFAGHFPQLVFAYQHVRLQARRDIVLGIAVVAICLFGIVMILGKDDLDPVLVYAPIWLPFAGTWIAVITVPFGLARAVLLDYAMAKHDDPVERTGIADRWRRRFLLIVGIFLLALTNFTQSGLIFTAAIFVLIGACAAYFQVRPYITVFVTFATSIGLRVAFTRMPDIMDLQPPLVIMFVIFLSAALLLVATKNSLKKYWQRRRIRKIFQNYR